MVRFTMSGRAMSNLLSLREPRDRHDRPVPGVRHLATQVVGGGHQAGNHRRAPVPPVSTSIVSEQPNRAPDVFGVQPASAAVMQLSGPQLPSKTLPLPPPRRG